MRYFRAHLAGVADPSSRRVEMAVHCDVAVFAWLLDWVRAKEARRRREGDADATDPAEAADDVPAPTLTPSNAVPVLVSSDFLRMDALADECLAFISDRLEDVARGPLDVTALDTRLLRRLARVTPAARLESLRSEGGNRTASPSRRRESVDLSRRASALAEALFERKTELEFFEGALRGRFARCDRCDRLFVAPGGAARGNSPTLPRELCAAAPRRVDYRGEVVAPHVPRAGPFDLRADVEALARRRRGGLDEQDERDGGGEGGGGGAKVVPWRDAYWYLWGIANALPPCARCGVAAPARDLGGCRYHPAPARFAAGAREGMRACCGAAVARFDPAAAHRADGCATRDHAFIEQEEEEEEDDDASDADLGVAEGTLAPPPPPPPRDSILAIARRFRRVIVEERGGANAVFREGAQFRGGGAPKPSEFEDARDAEDESGKGIDDARASWIDARCGVPVVAPSSSMDDGVWEGAPSGEWAGAGASWEPRAFVESAAETRERRFPTGRVVVGSRRGAASDDSSDDSSDGSSDGSSAGSSGSYSDSDDDTAAGSDSDASSDDAIRGGRARARGGAAGGPDRDGFIGGGSTRRRRLETSGLRGRAAAAAAGAGGGADEE